MCFKQPVHHTFVRAERTSYIDHILASQDACAFIEDCKILATLEDNVSDHLPLKVTMHLPVPDSTPGHHEPPPWLQSDKFSKSQLVE
jgi:hypothetical protein